MKTKPRSKAPKEDAARDENQVVGRTVGEIEERDEDEEPADPRQARRPPESR